jgi:hypothetical protein
MSAPKQQPKQRKKSPRRSDPQIDAYRRIRKPMPPPERVIPDKRREEAARIADRESRDDAP